MDHVRPVTGGAPAGRPVGRPAPLRPAAPAGRGDEAAFAELYDATSARVYGLAVRVVRDPAQAEEVTQEAYPRGLAHQHGSTPSEAARLRGC